MDRDSHDMKAYQVSGNNGHVDDTPYSNVTREYAITQCQIC
jgi:hypothetical protein